MEMILGLADFTYFLTKFRYKRIGDVEILERAAAMELDCVQVDLALKDEDGGAAARERVRERAAGLGIELVGAVYGPPTPAEFKRALLAGVEVGASVVRYACGPFRLMQAPVPVDELRGALADAAAVAEEHGLVLAVENHQDYPAEQLAGILDAVGSEHVGVNLDTGNSIALCEDPLETVRVLAPYTHALHLKEYAVLRCTEGFDLVGVTLGEGVVDNEAALAIVRDAAPAARLPVLIENPLERCRIPAFTLRYWNDCPGRTLGSLAPVGALLDRSAELFPDGIVLPHESGLPAELVMAAEHANNVQAVRYARETLGL